MSAAKWRHERRIRSSQTITARDRSALPISLAQPRAARPEFIGEADGRGRAPRSRSDVALRRHASTLRLRRAYVTARS